MSEANLISPITAETLPRVLVFTGIYSKQSAISVQRALKHAHQIILDCEPVGDRSDSIQVALDDLELLIQAVK